MAKKVSSKKSLGNRETLGIIKKLKDELSKVVVGQEEIIDGILMAMIADGHVLVEGVPGIAKSLVVKTIAVITGCDFSRIQFTVDLLPTDIVGITTLSPNRRSYEVLKGPVFSNFVMTDEVNRAPPKTQSALLEAMGERQVSIGKKTYLLQKPFFVMATQNPIETAGTYPLPEAQLDRFLFKLVMRYPTADEEWKIIEQNISLKPFESYNLKKIITPQYIIKLQKEVKGIKHTDRIKRYIVDIVNATRSPKDYSINTGKYITLGASPRASIFLFIAAKARAMLNGDAFITPQHVKDVAHAVLRHRLMLNYRAKVDNITTDDVIQEVLNRVKVP